MLLFVFFLYFCIANKKASISYLLIILTYFEAPKFGAFLSIQVLVCYSEYKHTTQNITFQLVIKYIEVLRGKIALLPPYCHLS